MKVYIDTSALNRIFDDQSQPRIYLESSAMLTIFMLIDINAIDLLASNVLLFENEFNPYEERQIFVNLCIQKAAAAQEVNHEILYRAQELEAVVIKGLDALHIACAEALKADYFLTCDDRLIKRYNGHLKVQNPVDFALNFLKKEETNGD